MAHTVESSVKNTPSAAETKKDAANPGAAIPLSEQERRDARMADAKQIVRRNVYWALGVGLIPFPVVDFIGLTGVELKMINELSRVYDVKFSENTAKSLVSSLGLSIGSLGIAGMFAGSMLKLIPIVGQALGLVGVSVIAAAFTQALGNTFIMHFESGGSLLNFDVEKMRTHFKTEFEKAKVTVGQLRKDETAKAAP